MRCLPLFLVVLAVSAAQAGVVIESVERNARTGQTLGTQRLLAQDGAVRIEYSAGKADSSYVIFRDEVLYVVEPAQRRYTPVDRETVEKLAGTMNAAMQQMRAQFAKMPPEQRAMMEQMMGHMGGAPAATRAPPESLQARDLGRSDKVAGRSCRLWELSRGGVVEQQICVVPFWQVPGKEDLLALSRRMAALMHSLSEAMPTFGGSSRDVEAMDSVRGYPVLIRDFDGGKPTGREVSLQSWREEALAAAQFEVPAHFRKQDPLKDLRR